MTPNRNTDFLKRLVDTLRSLPAETEWVELKQNIANPQDVGERISGLSNSATLLGKPHAYIIWGISDEAHEIVGTTFEPRTAKVGNEELENWLVRSLNPRLDIRFFAVEIDGKKLIILEIPRASHAPTDFHGVRKIRVGSITKNLTEYPNKERELWKALEQVPSEEFHAAEGLSPNGVIELLDYPGYFELTRTPLPDGVEKIVHRLAEDRMASQNAAGSWDITNLGAILFARNMSEVKHLARKAVRVIIYQGKDRSTTKREELGKKGYANGFTGLIEYLNTVLPRNEVLKSAIREEVPMYPMLAVRELLANALIHQDFSITGAGPMVEVFSDRLEISNPGEPLVSPDRFLDAPPRSRNESLASFMRRIGICEERGSGIDKVVKQTELFQLPAPVFETTEGFTRSILFAHKSFDKMKPEEKMRACYWHAALKWAGEDRSPITNSSLRERFKIEDRDISVASRIISDTIEAKFIKPYDSEQSKKYSKYVPIWA